MTSLRTLAYIVVAAGSMLLAAVQAVGGSLAVEVGAVGLDDTVLSAAPDAQRPAATPVAGH